MKTDHLVLAFSVPAMCGMLEARRDATLTVQCNVNGNVWCVACWRQDVTRRERQRAKCSAVSKNGSSFSVRITCFAGITTSGCMRSLVDSVAGITCMDWLSHMSFQFMICIISIFVWLELCCCLHRNVPIPAHTSHTTR